MQSDVSDLAFPGPDTLPPPRVAQDEDQFEEARGLIDSVVKPLIAINFQGRILEITPVAAMLLKSNPGKLTGGTISAILPELAEDLERLATPGISTVAHRVDGTKVPVRLTAMRVCTPRLEGWLIFIQIRKTPTLQDGLSQIEGIAPTKFGLP